eukprot:GHVT01003190.1.p1 GENE.GHVT01003190.1~~GHVT01003190.1.p1  ORF type:complete len:126 (-),score=11.71 GHVT01003190.1:634-1011(-)
MGVCVKTTSQGAPNGIKGRRYKSFDCRLQQGEKTSTSSIDGWKRPRQTLTCTSAKENQFYLVVGVHQNLQKIRISKPKSRWSSIYEDGADDMNETVNPNRRVENIQAMRFCLDSRLRRSRGKEYE